MLNNVIVKCMRKQFSLSAWLKRNPSVSSSSLHFSKLITLVRLFFSSDTSSAMVSIKFSRGKFSRPATGFECIAHAQTFDRGVTAVKRLSNGSKRKVFVLTVDSSINFLYPPSLLNFFDVH